jgi:ApaG protein
MSNAITNGIRVIVKPMYWAERSNPDVGQWAFAYTVTISNEGTDVATLRARHWIITDANGHTEEVRGEGVVGQQPRLAPGENFEYTSWAMLKTPFGSMRGEYFFEKKSLEKFEANIAEFALSLPHAVN